MKNILYIISLILIVSCNSSDEKKTNQNLETKEKIPSFAGIEPNRYNVAFLVMDGTYNTELTAPFDIFQHTILEIALKL